MLMNSSQHPDQLGTVVWVEVVVGGSGWTFCDVKSHGGMRKVEGAAPG